MSLGKNFPAFLVKSYLDKAQDGAIYSLMPQYVTKKKFDLKKKI